MYEEHEDGSFTLHMCEWYEQGRRLVGEYETLGDGSGFAVTDEWPAGLKVVVNHPLTRPDGTVMPGISRLRSLGALVDGESIFGRQPGNGPSSPDGDDGVSDS